MNGGQNNPGTVRITVTPNGSNPVQLSRQEVDKIVRCDKLEMLVLNQITGAVVGRGVYYPNTAFTGEENIPGTFELFSFGVSTAIALTINKVIIDTVTNKLTTGSFTYAPKTES